MNLIATDDDITEKTNSRCDQICDDDGLNLLETFKPDCQRGCRYFNIEFLQSAGNLEKVTDLNTTQNQCKMSCEEAYEEISRRETCHLGCSRMYEIQSKAPYFHGWLVYMGASDRSMVLMQPDFDIVSEDDWILLDAFVHPREYENIGDTYKLTETRIQTMPIYPMRKNLTMEFCIPTWMWMVPIFLVLGLVWIHYGNTIRNIFIYEECQDDDATNVLTTVIQAKDSNHKNGDFIVALESYFYPTPAIPPPKYTDIEKEFLLTNVDESDEKHIGKAVINDIRTVPA